jgi:DNA polymerase-3 subunit gamma/tau
VALRAAAQLKNIPYNPNVKSIPYMSYVALARKWRPRTFSQLVGQEHINRALINSLTQQRLHHAYLFTGTRGVGKTSIARILAKALNCETGISAEPCLTCDACIAIEQGRFIDLIEIDGASRTRVEDTRELLDNVQYVPTNGRFKIYLIDEVHMLSTHSFNALLKTLEEPPLHVKFFLATTDPQKLPVTVLSRCLQFNLKHVDADVICNYLQHVLNEEQLPYENAGLELLATAARGSMRDALSLLDQAIASSGHTLQTQDIKNMLGVTQQDYALQLLQALAEPAPQKLIDISRHISTEGGHFKYATDQILNYLHQMSICQSIPNSPALIRPAPEIIALSTQFTPEDVQLFYQIGIKATEDIHLAPTPAIGFEMMLLRMYTFRPASQDVVTPPLIYQTISNTPRPIELDNNDSHGLLSKPSVLPPTVNIEKPPAPVEIIAQPQIDTSENEDWGMLLPTLKLTGLALNAAENAEFVSKSDSEVTLRVSKGHLSVFTSAVIKRIEQGLTNHYKEVVKLTLSSDEAVSSSPAQQRQLTQVKAHENAAAALENDPFFQQLQQEFSAELVSNSITSLKDDL